MTKTTKHHPILNPVLIKHVGFKRDVEQESDVISYRIQPGTTAQWAIFVTVNVTAGDYGRGAYELALEDCYDIVMEDGTRYEFDWDRGFITRQEAGLS